jgi:predicted ester cyclase
MFETYFKAFPDLHFETEQILTSGDYLVERARVTGTHKGNLMGIAPTNKTINIQSCNVVEVRNGKIIRSRIYADNAKMLQQLGVLSLPKTTQAAG